MRILHVINSLQLGGAENLLVQVVVKLEQEEGYTNTVLLLDGSSSVFIDDLSNKGIEVIDLGYRNIYNPLLVFKLRKIFNNGNYDIIHSHLFPTQYWVAFATISLKSSTMKFITTEHSTYNNRRSLKVLRPLEKMIYNNYDKIISISEATEINIKNWLKPDEKNDKFIIIENGLDLQYINEVEPIDVGELIENAEDDSKYICMSARFSEAKDQETIIRTMSQLPTNVNLILIGDGVLLDKSIALSEELNLSNRVHFLGFRSDVIRILKSVDLVIISSHWEGLSLSLIEGLASGKPVVVSDVEGLKEFVDGAAVLFKHKNPDDLSNEIMNLLDNESYYNTVSLNCFNLSKRFDIRIMIRKLKETYSK